MQKDFRLDLQFFAEGASAGDGGAAGVTSAAAGQNTGAAAADAGQTMGARLEELGVPKNRIKKGAWSKPARPEQGAPAEAKTEAAEAQPAEETAPSGDADRKSWDDIKSEYKAEYDAEVQDTIRKRVRNEQARTQRYVDRENARAPMDMFFAERYKLDPDSDDFYEKMVEAFRADSEISQGRAVANGYDDEVQHKLDLAKADEDVQRLKRQREEKLQAVFYRRKQAEERYAKLREQADGLADKIPGIDIDRELRNPAFVAITQPGTGVTVEQAYFALHPEYREQLEREAAQKATEAVSASVRAGAMRPAENGSQAASIGRVPYRDLPQNQREDLKRRIREAGYEGRHIPVGG